MIPSFKHEYLGGGWSRITIVAQKGADLPDTEIFGTDARIRIVKFIFASCTGLLDAAGYPETSAHLADVGCRILEGFAHMEGPPSS